MGEENTQEIPKQDAGEAQGVEIPIEEQRAWEQYWDNLKAAHPDNPNIPSREDFLAMVPAYERSDEEGMPEWMLKTATEMERGWGIQ